MSKLTISLVTYNSERYLLDFADAMRAQTFKDWELIVIDNNSTDQSVQLIRDYLPMATVSRQSSNLGFAKAHNLAISWSKSPYILVVNPDMVLEPDMLTQMVRAIEKYEDVASVAPKLLSWDAEKHKTGSIVDTCGLLMRRNYHVHDRFQGMEDPGPEGGYVFGASGSCALYRRTALEQTRVPKKGGGFEYFDEDFFMYKEDVDLAWRMTLAGWRHYFVPQAVGYHQRTISGRDSSRRDRRARAGINRYSYRNHLLTVYKNHFWTLTFRHILSIMLFETGKFVYLATLDGSSLRAWREIMRLAGRMRTKRRHIVAARAISAGQFRRLLE